MSDEQYRSLVERCLENDRSAQYEFYQLHSDKMYSICMYYAKDRQEASDFLQEGYLKVFKKLHTFTFSGSLEGWIRRIIVNTALSHIRKKRKTLFNDMPIEEIPDVADVKDEEIEILPSAKVIEMVDELPEKSALVLKLFAIEGYTHHEIAELMDITVGTSKSQLSRARTLLKQAIKDLNGK